jgi:hypothetical protein
VTKTGTQLDREISEFVGLPAAIMKKWKSKVAAYKRAVAAVEEGYTDAGVLKMAKARDALDKLIYEATAHVPYVVGGKPHLSPPIQALEAERKELVSSTWERAKERGREANYRRGREEIAKLEEAERAARAPYEWMRR